MQISSEHKFFLLCGFYLCIDSKGGYILCVAKNYDTIFCTLLLPHIICIKKKLAVQL